MKCDFTLLHCSCSPHYAGWSRLFGGSVCVSSYRFLVWTFSFIYFILSYFSVFEDKRLECRRQMQCSEQDGACWFCFPVSFWGRVVFSWPSVASSVVAVQGNGRFLCQVQLFSQLWPIVCLLSPLPSLLISFCVLVSLSEHNTQQQVSTQCVSVVPVCVRPSFTNKTQCLCKNKYSVTATRFTLKILTLDELRNIVGLHAV